MESSFSPSTTCCVEIPGFAFVSQEVPKRGQNPEHDVREKAILKLATK
jgi:hypothetical protein